MKYGFIKKEIKGEKGSGTIQFPNRRRTKSERKSSDWKYNGSAIKTGTKKYTKEQLNDKLDALKSNIGFGFGGQSLSVNVNTL